ncbi:hypothetical protein ABL78_6332 [Leptomonas seymouri]|uniref:Zinc finger LSD1-type domain-containing protein n=1 Tax=Leptomonas seymouri TaxID=5684 RepID=A0A0N0P4B1_LEPSE|nr:hypothetical protein ABL78_6332 [Leptomonas seymouri]|eukprot:KPI84627.1 hypothetical protein ABL78_6332 [Leptomonas seymouri]
MMLFGELACYGCQRILSYPLGAISCRCRQCNTINAAQNLQITCGACGQDLHVPINTLSFLCPCCGTVTDIPEELLPPLPSCVNLSDGADDATTAIYVSHPTLSRSLAPQPPADNDSSPVFSALPPPPHSPAHARERSSRSRQSCDHSEAVQGTGTADQQANVREASETPQDERQREGDGEANGSASTPAAAAERKRVSSICLAPTVMVATRIL